LPQFLRAVIQRVQHNDSDNDKNKGNARFRLVLFAVGRPEGKKGGHLPGRSKSSVLFGGPCAIPSYSNGPNSRDVERGNVMLVSIQDEEGPGTSLNSLFATCSSPAHDLLFIPARLSRTIRA